MNRIFWGLLDLARATSAITHEYLAPFLLQLLAWKSLEDDPRVPELAPISTVMDEANVQAATRLVLTYLREAPGLGPDGRAFEFENNVLESFSVPDLCRLLKEIDQVTPGMIAPDEVISFLSETRELGRRGTFDTVRPELAGFMARLAGAGSSLTLYVPFDSSFNLAVQAALLGSEVYAEYRDTGVASLTSLMNILLGTRIQTAAADPVMAPGWVVNGALRQFDAALSCPPFGVRYRDQKVVDRFNRFPEDTFYGEVLQIRHIMAQTKEWAVVAAPNSLLLRGTGNERDFKADLLKRGHLAAVVSLHGGMLASTQIAFSLLVIKQGEPVERTLMVNATGEHFTEPGKTRGSFRLRNVEELLYLIGQREEGPFSRLVSPDECAATDYNLLPERYVHTGATRRLEDLLSEEKTVPLEDLVDLIRPQFLKSDDDEPPAAEFPEVAAQDLGDDGHIEAPAKRVGVSAKMLSKAKQQLLQPHDVLLLNKGWSVGKVAIVPSNLSESWLANQSFLILRLRPNPHISSPVVLMRYLASPMGQALLAKRAGGSTIPMLQTKEVRTLPVIVPDKEQEEAVLATDQEIVETQQRIRDLQDAVGHLKRRHWALPD